MTKIYRLYGMSASLYTGKVRAYMRRNHIPFIEETAGGERFENVVKPAVGRWIIPVVETPEGEFIQDGTDILDYFERQGFSRQSLYPKDPRLALLSHVFELFGGEGLLRPAMHYRWNFDAVNLAFLKVNFEDVMPFGLSGAEKAAAFDFASGRMRKAATFFGVTPETFTLIEESYQTFLSLLDAHFESHPFVLGEEATHGDYGLFNPLYAHLGRDPKPLQLMQTTAPHVYKWVERMNAPEDILNNINHNFSRTPLQPEALPDTLIALLRFIAEDYLPELTAHIEFTNNWLTQTPDPVSAFNPKKRVIGMARFDWRGTQITSSVMPYRQYLLQRVQDAYDGLDGPMKHAVDDVFQMAGLRDLLDVRAMRRVTRENHLEAWV